MENKNEMCYNVFMIYENNEIVRIGIKKIELTGSDESKLKFLQKMVNQHWENCETIVELNNEEFIKINLLKRINYNEHLIYIYSILENKGIDKYNENPLAVYTPIYNNKPTFNTIHHL